MVDNPINKAINSFDKTSLIDKTENYHLEKEDKVERLRTKFQKEEENFSFQPKINAESKNMKRNLNDLYVLITFFILSLYFFFKIITFQLWKNKVVNRLDLIKKKELEEEEISNRVQNFTPNKVSQMINQKNNYSGFKRNLNRSQDHTKVQDYDDIEFDLWPDIQKSYHGIQDK